MSEDDYLFFDNDDSVPPYLEKEPRIPLWLKLVILIVPFWGFATFYIYWNGNFSDWLDRGYWAELQQAANTTLPAESRPRVSAEHIEVPKTD